MKENQPKAVFGIWPKPNQAADYTAYKPAILFIISA